MFRRVLAIALVMGFVASACGSADSASTAEATTESVPVASELLAGEFATLDGTSIDLDAFAGEDVVLWFWAPW